MKLQKINGHQSFGMAHTVDYTGVNPIEREALEAINLADAFGNINGTVRISKMCMKQGSKWAFPANWLYTKLLATRGYKPRFVFELPASSVADIGRHYTGLGIRTVNSDSVAGLQKVDLVRVIGKAVSEVKGLCGQAIRNMAKAS